MGITRKLIKSLKVDLVRLRSQQSQPKTWDRQELAWPFHTMFHPFAGISDIKYEGRGSVRVSLGILIAYFVTSILRFFYTGFIFNMSNIDEFNLLTQMLSSVLLVVLWSVSNWSVSTLMDGEGKFRDIWIVSSYAVLPKIITDIIVLILSQFMVYGENVFLVTIEAAGTLWMAALLVIGMLIVHQYSMGKTLLCCLVTILGILAILFIVILFISIVQQMIGFIDTITLEILNRS